LTKQSGFLPARVTGSTDLQSFFSHNRRGWDLDH